MKILFRTDASSTIGLGHVIRDLVLAKQYAEDEVLFATRALKGNLNRTIKEAGYKVKRLKSNRLEELIMLIKKLKIEMVVIDVSSIDHVFEKELKERTGVTIMVLDDFYKKHHCDILLNHNIYADESQYKGLVPKGCTLRCGEEFMLLRGEFFSAKEHKKEHKKDKISIFLAMGGVDKAGLNILILQVLEAFPDIHINVLTTTANRNLRELESYVEGKNSISLHIDSDEVANIMASCQMAIIPPNATLHEVNFMELLFIPIQTEDNQQEMVNFLEASEYPVLKEFDAEVLYHTIKSFIIFHQQ
jgi:UDP-2,4-diacetamido-2,4,6-trideoxy-beta-L-altropyranose hydrolase